MAETLGEFYLRLGLSLADLESDFVDAERTLQQNISRLSHQQNLIQLRANVEIGNLDETADAEQILTVRTRALNEQMAIQRDRIRIAEANLRDMTQRHGESAAVTQSAAQALERERLRLQAFERELRDVERAQRDLNDAQNDSTNGAESFGDALDNISGKAAGLYAVVEVFNSISESVQETAEKFRELQNQSYELNLPVGQTKEFLRELKLAGGDIGDFEGYIRGISDAYVKGEFDDPEFIALSKYGAKITDATGRLKNFEDITEEVYQAYLKAKAAGEEIEFLQLTGGEAGVRDAIQFFERYKEAKEDAAKVFNADLDAGAFHQLDRALSLVEEQSNELKQAIADIFAPAITQGAENLFELLHAGTEILTENKEEFKSWGFIAAESINLVLDPLKELKTTLENADDDSFLGAFKHTAKELGKTAILGTPTKLLDDFGAFEGIIDRATEKQIAYNNAIKDTTATWANFRLEQEKTAAKGNPLNQYDTKRITQYRDELEDLRLELEYTDDEYNKALAQNDLWLQRGLTRPNFLSPDEEKVLRELHAAKVEQIEQEKEDRIAEIREQAERERRTDLENTLADIEQEKEKRISAGMEAAEAVRLAAEESAAAIRDVEDAFTEKVNSFRNSALQNQYDAIDKERDDWIKKGVDPEQANAFADEQRYKALQELEESFSQRINDIRGNDLANQLARIEQEKQAWIDKGIEETRAEELANEQRAQVLQDYADKQQQAEENYVKQVKQREEQIAKIMADYRKRVAESMERQFDEALSVLKSQLDAFKAYRDGGIKGLEEYERKQLKKQGITDKDLQSMTKTNLDDFKQAQKDIKRNLLPNFQPVNDVPFPELPPPIETPQAFADLNSEIYRATDALENFAETADGKRYYLNDLYNGTGYAEDADGNRYYLNDLNNTPNPDIPNYTPQDNADFNPNLNQPVTDPLSNLGDFDNPLDRLSQEIAGMTQGLNDTVKALSEMTSAIAQVGTPDRLNDYPQTAQNPPANINTTIQIEEAHAWDYDHIRELAELVADILSPVIVNAVGGDSNGY